MKNCFDNWSDIRVFLAVLREGSTLAASKKLGMAQPTVARRIDALEHGLALALFDRDTRGFRPTAHACDLVAEAEAVEAAILALADKARDLANPKPIRIAAFAENLRSNTLSILSEFNQDYPDVRFEFLPGVRNVDLMAGEADVAIRIAFTTPEPELIQRKISVAQFSLYASKSYVAAHGLPKSPADFVNHSFVSFMRNDAHSFIQTWISANVPEDRILRVYSEVELMNSEILSGRAIGMVNVRMAKNYPDLVQCIPPPPELDADHVILIPPEAWRRPEVKAFIRFFAPRYAALFRDGGGS